MVKLVDVKRSVSLLLLVLSMNCSAITTVSWTAPTQNIDSTPLTDLVGYTIRYQCNSRPTQYINITDPTVVQYVMPSNIVGDCDFWINAINSVGLASEWSNKSSKLIKLDKPTAGGIR